MEAQTVEINVKKTGLPKQKLKRHVQRILPRCFNNFVVTGVLFISALAICTTIQFRIVNKKSRRNSNFQSLFPQLKFDDPSERFDLSQQFKQLAVEAERKDWHDYAAIFADEKRTGPGEQGQATKNTDESKIELAQQLREENIFNAILSEKISVNRSLPKVMIKDCFKKLYLAKLPTVSIVMPCRNEFYSVLRRSLHSIVNRTPKELLKEIIIVDDHSTRGYFISEMELYAEKHFPNLVKFLRLTKRRGLMYVRAAGAKLATADVIVFLDSHIECNHNWLPPLLEPIAINERISTTPIIDTIDYENFAYYMSEGWRGGFRWNLSYKMKMLPYGPNIDESTPYKDAIMMGGLFAISRKFFWELGGYDEGLQIWGGEQFEISFKIWMCGGMLLTVPCSHVGHIFIVPFDNKRSPTDTFFQERNNKRIAEVWMDDYKHYVYATNPDVYYQIDAGDLSEQHAVRKRMKCKSFQWFLDFVAPDFRVEHPFDLPPDYANGTIRSLGFPNLCLDTMSFIGVANVGIYQCAENLKIPYINQMWNFNIRQQIKNFYNNWCLDVFSKDLKAQVSKYYCHKDGGNQFWHYDKNRKWLVHGENGTRCMEAVQQGKSFRIQVNKCEQNNKHMQWIFGYVNAELDSKVFLQKKNQQKLV